MANCYNGESSCNQSIPVENSDDRIRAICVDVVKLHDDLVIAECYSMEKRHLYTIRVPKGRACKTWQLEFTIGETHENGISEVRDYEILEEPSMDSRNVVLRRDGDVMIKCHVAISYCPHHESYDGQVFWSEEFGRVLSGEDKAERLVIYSTFVKRDKSDLAKSLGVDFRICEILKEVPDEAVCERCKNRMIEEQEAQYEEAHPPLCATPERRCSDIGQASFSGSSFSANYFAFREGKPRGNGLFIGTKMPKALHGSERLKKMSEYKKQESDNCLLLFTKKKRNFSEAWCKPLGRVMVINTVFNGYELKVGDWFHASVRLFQELFKNVEPIYVTKRIIDLADPLAHTDCFLDEIQVEIECTGEYVRNDHGRVIFDHTLLGNVKMTVEQSREVRSRRMLCALKFNHDNPYHRPWRLVRLIRELSEQESMLSDERGINGSELSDGEGNPSASGYRQRGEGAQAGRYDNFNESSARNTPSTISSHRCPLLDEAFDIVGHLLYEREVYAAVQQTCPWLLHRMTYFMALRDEDSGRRSRNSRYDSPSGSNSRQERSGYHYRRDDY